ncbi:hypothetical protein [Isorropodon fossajaponicum symbiont]|nr:hypothetical protein [Isorropodon fossajaponicum symbiont]
MAEIKKNPYKKHHYEYIYKYKNEVDEKEIPTKKLKETLIKILK